MSAALHYVHRVVIPAALSMLPLDMRKPEAAPMLLAIGLQESAFDYRVQVGGPAVCFWQFEKGGGFDGVLGHLATGQTARAVLTAMAYGDPDASDFRAMQNNDILACVFARLLLWTHPDPLPGPGPGEVSRSWNYYNDLWRPGAPHPEKWPDNFNLAWKLCKEA